MVRRRFFGAVSNHEAFSKPLILRDARKMRAPQDEASRQGRRIRKVTTMKVALGVVVGLVIGFLAMTYFKTGHLPF
jgi:F0F1-type ATP synthase assembly protein I